MSGSRVLISCKVFLKVSSSRERLSTVVVKQVPGLVYKRPHVSRTEPNKYAFIGICLKSDWKSCFTTFTNYARFKG